MRAIISFSLPESERNHPVLEIARGLPGYRTTGAGVEAVHHVDVPLSLDRPEEWDKARRLASLSGNLINAGLVLQGTTAKTFEELDRGVIAYADIDPGSVMRIIPRDDFPESRLGAFLSGEYDKGMKLLVKDIPPVRYSDIFGQEAAIQAVKNVVQLPLTNPEYFTRMGLEPQRGIILYGPPGNGKTMIARAVATESNAHLEIINGPEVLSKWVGESEERLREIFRAAKERAPSVILIDEIDSLAPSRDSVSNQHEIALVSQLLVLLDGLESRGRVAVIATTNRIDAIDPAVRRSGRFDYHILVPPPDVEGRLAILRGCLSKMRVEEGMDAGRLAPDTDGFSGADLASLCREAGMSAIQRGIAQGIKPDELVVTGTDLRAAVAAIREKRKN